MLDLVVLNYNDSELTAQFVMSVKEFEIVSHIVVVDNCSSDGSFEKLQKISDKKVFVIKTPKNGGYGYGNNYGVLYAKKYFNSKYVAISNPDVILRKECLSSCELFLDNNPDFAMVAPKMLDTNFNYSNGAWLLPTWKTLALYKLVFAGKKHHFEFVDFSGSEPFVECDCLAGSFFIIRVDAFINVGLFDENIFLYYEETVIGKKLKEKGFKAAVLKDSTFIHAHSVSIKKSIKSSYKREKIMWSSLQYVLKTYYKTGFFKNIFIGLIKIISLFERLIYERKHSD